MSERKDKAFKWSELWQKTKQTEPRFYNSDNKWCVATVTPSGCLELNLSTRNIATTLDREEALEFSEWIRDFFE